MSMILTACNKPASPKDPENEYRMAAFSEIAKRVGHRDFSIDTVIPFDEKTSLLVTTFSDTMGNDYNKLYKMDMKSTGLEVGGDYSWDKHDLMAISVNTASFSNGTVIYGDINNDHMSSVDKMLMPVDLDSIHIKLENDPNLVKATLYDGFYMVVIKRPVVLEEVLFVNKKTSDDDMPYNYTYGAEYEYIESLTPKSEVEEGEPLYSKFVEGSDEWYIAKYVSPLVFTGALVTEGWTNPSVIPYDVFGRLFLAIVDSNALFDYKQFYDAELDRYMIPENFFEDTIRQYFDVPVKHLRLSPTYKKTAGVYALSEYYNGISYMTVESITEHTDNTFTLIVNAYNSEPLTEENLACRYNFTIEQGKAPHIYKYTAYSYESFSSYVSTDNGDLNNNP